MSEAILGKEIQSRLPDSILGGIKRATFDLEGGFRRNAHRMKYGRMKILDSERLFHRDKRSLVSRFAILKALVRTSMKVFPKATM